MSAHRYEPEANRTYECMAEHYGLRRVACSGTAPEGQGQSGEGRLGRGTPHPRGPLRNRTFFSLRELNEAIEWKLIEYNARPFQKLEGSRRSLFEQLGPTGPFAPLPAQSYEYAEWKKARV